MLNHQTLQSVILDKTPNVADGNLGRRENAKKPVAEKLTIYVANFKKLIQPVNLLRSRSNFQQNVRKTKPFSCTTTF